MAAMANQQTATQQPQQPPVTTSHEQSTSPPTLQPAVGASNENGNQPESANVFAFPPAAAVLGAQALLNQPGIGGMDLQQVQQFQVSVILTSSAFTSSKCICHICLDSLDQ